MNRRNLLLGMGAVTAAGAGFYLAGRGPDHAAAAAALRSPRSARSNADLPYLVHPQSWQPTATILSPGGSQGVPAR